MAYTITTQKIVSIITDSVDADGLPVWHAEENQAGDKTEVSILIDTGDALVVYVDSVDPSVVTTEIDLLANSQ